MLKIQMIITKFKSDDSIGQILIEYKDTNDSVKLDALRKLVVQYLSHVDEIPAQNLKLCEEVLNRPDSELENDHCQACFKLLYNQKKLHQFVNIRRQADSDE
ncbi:uncharacterized protein LOC124373557 [Homalodisca vitripennis]|uniref:uncharacterized protein LOC124373557 n=1 Tax=Homalodisca vitripennis TaxID=197043 RepID=UPI001EEAA900|nr:uncharacterized protein LOC124373557 [Homalodisca vitripennis]